MLDANESLLCSKLCGHNVDNPTSEQAEFFAHFRQIVEKGRRARECEARVAQEGRSAENPGYFSAPLLACNSRLPRARLAFASVGLKYAKNYAYSAG